MKVFRKELFYADELFAKRQTKLNLEWAEKCDGIEVYSDNDLPNMYHAYVNGCEYVFHKDWCEVIEDDK